MKFLQALFSQVGSLATKAIGSRKVAAWGGTTGVITTIEGLTPSLQGWLMIANTAALMFGLGLEDQGKQAANIVANGQARK